MDEINTCTEWKILHNIASEEGIVAIGHEDKVAINISEFAVLYYIFYS